MIPTTMIITGIGLILGLIVLGQIMYLYLEGKITGRVASVVGGGASAWVVAVFICIMRHGSTS